MLELIAHQEPEQRILIGDVRECLRSLPDCSVQMAVTSPPYWGLRAYGTDPQVWGGDSGCDHDWTAGRTIKRDRQHMQEFGVAFGTGGGNKHSATSVEISTGDTCCRCGAWRGELGSEPTPRLFIEHMLEVFAEVKRVLRPDGVMFVNMGDSYNAYNGNAKQGGPVSLTQSAQRQSLPSGYGLSDKSLKPKDLIGVPWMLAFALRDELGLYLRQDIIWQKPAPMPESVTDRCTKSHEYIFLLSKSERYFFDAEAIKEPQSRNTHERFAKGGLRAVGTPKATTPGIGVKNNSSFDVALRTGILPGGLRNKRSVWTINTQPYKGAHFATFPANLVIPCIKAGTSEHGCCSACGAPWRRVVERTPMQVKHGPKAGGYGSRTTDGISGTMVAPAESVTTGWEPGCTCNAEVVPCVVLDPFLGSGTTLQVARHLGRRGVGCELNASYAELAMERIPEPLKSSKPKRQKRVSRLTQPELF